MKRSEASMRPRCCGDLHRCASGISRRELLAGVGIAALGAATVSSLSAVAEAKEAAPTVPLARTLTVQPVLVYSVPTRQKATSWRAWGGIQTEQQASEERERIQRELESLAKSADFPLEILPLISAKSPQELSSLSGRRFDVTLMYAAGGWEDTLRALAAGAPWSLMFVRHRSGPVYLWYEIAHPHFLRKAVDEYGQPGFTTRDVVVDRYDEVLWRLRALSGLKNTIGKRVVAVGGASGWGIGYQTGPAAARELWKLEIRDVSYQELAQRLRRARENSEMVKRCSDEADKYLKQSGVLLKTDRQFVRNAFLLRDVFLQLMHEAQTDTITINQCMGTIMPIAETTACLPLSLLNDEGFMAFCESDFVVIPSGILLHHISGKPVFLNDPTYPHDGVVTMAHCTAPRKMDGR
ncbi:MAG: sugar isomerase, partial [Armatimonadota bacterium]